MSQGGHVVPGFILGLIFLPWVSGILGCKGTASDIELGIPREVWGAPQPSGRPNLKREYPTNTCDGPYQYHGHLKPIASSNLIAILGI